MERRGMSPIIITVLIILLSLGAIGIIWSAIKTTIDPLENAGPTQTCLGLVLEVSTCSFNASTTRVQLRRGSSEGMLEAIKVVFTTSQGTTIRETMSVLPEPLETRNYYWPDITNPSSVDIAAVVGGKTCTLTGSPRTCVQVDSLQAPQCSDGIDNEGDGATDYPNDFSCASAADNDETNPLAHCQDGIDNDIDGLTDYPADLGCESHQDNDETDLTSFAECDNGLDDDSDGLADYPVDPSCTTFLDAENQANTPERLFVYAWNLFNYSLSNMIEFTMFGTDLPWNDPHFGYGYRTLNVSYFKNFTESQRARGGKSALMDWNLNGGGTNVFNYAIRFPLMNHSLDRCQYPNGTFTRFPCPWRDNGIAETAVRYDSFFRNLSQAGVDVDLLILDIEPSIGWWSITNWPCAGIEPVAPCLAANPYPFDGRAYTYALQNDRRNASLFAALGFENLSRIYNHTRTEPEYQIFDGTMIGWNARDIDAATYQAARAHYPSLEGANYAYDYSREPTGQYAHTYRQYIRGQAHVGTHQAPSLYPGNTIAVCVNETTEILYRCFDVNSPNYIDPTQFNGLRYTLNEMRSGILNSSVPMSPWIAFRSLDGSSVEDSDLYQELIMHIALGNADYLITWNPHPWAQGQNPDSYATDETDYYIDATVKEIQSLAWHTPRQTLISSLGSWKHDFYLTGLTSAGRKIWRFTPDPLTNPAPVRSLVIDEDPDIIIQTQNYTLTFDEGILYEPTNPISSRGIWIVQPNSAQAPVITPR